jgi:hypothetical protein
MKNLKVETFNDSQVNNCSNPSCTCEVCTCGDACKGTNCNCGCECCG